MVVVTVGSGGDQVVGVDGEGGQVDLTGVIVGVEASGEGGHEVVVDVEVLSGDITGLCRGVCRLGCRGGEVWRPGECEGACERWFR